MNFVTDERIRALAVGQSVVLRQTLLADTETPVSAFLKLRERDGAAILLESVEGGERWGRYSIIAAKPRRVLRLNRQGQASLDGAPYCDMGKPFDLLRRLTTAVNIAPESGSKDLPRFIGGWIGYLGFGAVHWIEPSVPDDKPEVTTFPEAIFCEVDAAVLFDNVQHTMSIIVIAHPQADQSPRAVLELAAMRVQKITAALRTPLNPDQSGPPPPVWAGEFKPAQSKESFKQAVETVRQAILAGDAIQVVVSQRFYCPFKGDAFSLYRALRLINPSPYLFYMAFDEGTLIGSSPEVLVRKEGKLATLRPIAGTRKRGATPERDLQLERELLADPKEIAEHVMLVDLGRNDLGRVCAAGSVQVTEKMLIERYSHVMHIVSNVEGRLRDEADAWSLLQATFPAGTVSGAPKVKALQLIQQVEAERRGPYAGAVGYVDYRGDLDTGIMIRTLYAWNNQLMLQAGAGIVADSDPELEYKETRNKANAAFAAVKLAQQGFVVAPSGED